MWLGGGGAELLRGLLRVSERGFRRLATPRRKAGYDADGGEAGGEAMLRARPLARVARPCCLFLCGVEGAVLFFYRGEDDGCFSLSLPLFSTFHPWHISQVMRLLSSIHQEVFLWSVGISLKSVVQSSQSLSFRSRVIFELSLFERALWSHLALAIPLEVYL